jgi:hypothetical protein
MSTLLLVTCAHGDRGRTEIPAIERDAAVAFALCNRGRRQGILRTAVEHAKCINAVEDRYLRAQYPYDDLYALRRAQRVALATKQDQKHLTEEHAQLEFAKASAKIDEEADRRRAAGIDRDTRPRDNPPAFSGPTHGRNEQD